MPFQKGKPKTGGIKKGQIQNRTRQWQEIGEYLTNKGVSRVLTILDQASDQAFMQYYQSLIKYFKPQLSSQTVKEDKEALQDQEIDPEQQEDLKNAIEGMISEKIFNRLQTLEGNKSYEVSELKEILLKRPYQWSNQETPLF